MKDIIRNNNPLRAAFLAAFSLACTLAFAQTRVTGVVRDAAGDPVPGAVIMLEGHASVGTTSGSDGGYLILLPSSAKNPVLKAMCIGYIESSQAVSGRSAVDFSLEEEKQEIEEVVVVGYGSMRRSDLTGSVTSVRIDEGEAARSTSIDQLLQGRASGVQVLNAGGAPDAGVSIRIRGLSSFNGSTEPLYVVDGIIINASQGGEALLTQGSDNSGSDEETNGLMGINPQDIESIEILKDASATAIYGALGANGVVMITTKVANRDRPTVTFSSGLDFHKVSKRQDILTFDEYCDYLRTKRDLGTGTGAETYLGRIFEDPARCLNVKVYPVEWQDVVLRTAVGQRYYFSTSGRPKNLSYAFSLGYSDNEGIVKRTGVKQYTVRLNLDKTVNKKFKFGTKTSAAYVDSDMTQGTGGGRMTSATSCIRSMVSYRPYSTTELNYDDDEDDDEEDLRSSPDKWINKVHFINYRKEYRINPSLYAEYRIFPWLTFKSTLGGDYRNSERQKFKSSKINTTAEGTNGASGTYEQFNWNWDNSFMFNKKIRSHSISGTVGSSAHKTSSTTQSVEGWNIDQYMGGMESLNTAPNTSLTYSENASQTLSFFARGIYNYRDRYVLTATYRADGSSKFQAANKWAFFPSFAFAWRMNQEPWFKVRQVSMMKIRLGWGRVGNQSVSSYRTLENFSTSRIASHDLGNESETTVSLSPSNMANPNLKWETTEQLNAGLDAGFWRGRLTFTVDAYNKVTYDLLQSKAVPTTSGYSTISMNEGTILNRGVEFSLDATPLKKKMMELNIDGNISFNKNRIVRISDTADRKAIWVTTDRSEEVVYFEGSQIGTSNYCVQTANIFMEGYPMGLFYGYKIRKILDVGETGLPVAEGGEPGVTGQFDYYDLNGNGHIDEEDRTVIGNPNPKFLYGFGAEFRYGRLSMRMTFNGSYGNDIFNINSACETDTYNSNRNIFRGAFYDAWTPDNKDTIYPALGMIRADDYKKFSDFYVEDGSYLRLANISVSYRLPLKYSKVLKEVSCSASVKNVYVWTKYRGWDPNVNSFGTNIKKMGVDSGSYPSCRTASFDIKFTF